MNSGSERFQRTPGDFISFALGFVGFIIGIAGLITTTVPAFLTGFILIGLVLCYFMLKS